MTVTITVDDHDSQIAPETAGTFVYSNQITLPNQIHLLFEGKNMMLDTICDPLGQIVQDKCVIIKKITLDGFPVDRYYLQKKLVLHESGSARTNRSNYVGHNGIMTLDLDCENVFFQIQKMSRMGKLDHAQ